MRTNVFLRSTRRQGVRTVFLLLVTALITFAFVARGAEYLTIRRETERLGAYYQSVGTLRPISEGQYKDAREAADLLSADPLVETVNSYNYVSGVIEDGFCNANTEFTMNYIGAHFVFSGRLVEWSRNQFKFLVDEVLAGPPEYMEEGQTVVLTRTQGRSQTLDMLEGLDKDPVDPDMPADFPWADFSYLMPVYSEQEKAYADLEMGGRYLAVGYYEPGKGSMCRVTREVKVDQVTGEEYELKTTYAVFSHSLEDAFFYRLPDSGEIDWSDPRLPLTRERLELIREETRALNVVPLRDMTALPQVQDPEAGIYLTQGRWLDRQDDEQENRVCVVSSSLATLRGLELGDTLTIKLRDIPSYFGQSGAGWDLDVQSLQTSTDTYEIVGIYDYLDTYGFTGTYNDVSFYYNQLETYANTAVSNFVYVPAFALPEGFRLDRGDLAYEDALNGESLLYKRWFAGSQSALPLPGSVSFRLTGPEVEEQFLEGARERLDAMGFTLEMGENGWDSFQAAAKPMEESSLYNAAVYTAVMLAALGLAAFIYYFSRRREMNIARSLGLPKGTAFRQITAPLLLIGAPAILLGSGAGWWYAGRSAAALLESLPEIPGAGQAGAPLPAVPFLVLLCGVPLVLLAALTLCGGAYLTGRPLVKQQMGVKKSRGASGGGLEGAVPGPSRAVSAGSAAVFASASAPRGASRSLGAVHVLRFVWRHMVRSWAKSLLTVALAVVFTVSLTAIQLSIAGSRQEIDDLYTRTSVGVELLKADSTQSTTAGAFLFDETLQTILDTGFISDCYIEGANYCNVFRYDEPWTPGEVLHVEVSETSRQTIRSTDSAEKFFSGIGSGSGVEITYADGWDGSLFSAAWDASTGEAVPIVLPKETWDEFQIRPGDLMAVACKGTFHMCAVAGYYEGQVAGEYKALSHGSRGYSDSLPILMPTSGLRSMVRNMMYSKAVFHVDPALNRDLEAFREKIEDLANTPRTGSVPVRTILRDEELRTVVEPIEASIRLMQVLYPVTLILSLLAAGGLSALLAALSAKEAAMMRIQGTTRPRTIAMLSLQQVFTCLAGLGAGLTGVLLYVGNALPDLLGAIAPGAVVCAALYLTAGAAGAVASSAAVTGKNPLEMLQVRE